MSSKNWRSFSFALSATLALSLVGCSSSSSSPSTTNVTPPGNPVGPNLTQISSDAFTVGPGQHATEVEPHMLANGNTLVAAFQTGRISPTTAPKAGSTDIGWATSTDGGTTRTHGNLPGLTTGEGSGPYDAVSDPNVGYDAKHGVWLISTLPVSSSMQTPATMVSRSVDGLTWQTPVAVYATSPSSDKNWIVCDNTQSSPYYGNCYVEWDQTGNSDLILMSTSSDGGLTWSTPVTPTTAIPASGLGGQPLVQPNGTVVVPIETFANNSAFISTYLSSNGGASWTAPVTIATIQIHVDAAGIRSGPLPSAAVDGAGTVWVVWEDCRFRAGCSTNDLVYSTSTDGVNWSAVTRIPIDAVTSSADYFIPGIGIDPATSGTGAHVALHYYYYSQTACEKATCNLAVGYISSANGGTTWSAPSALTGPMLVTWLPDSQNGLMVGDYIATAFTNGVPHGVFAVAMANTPPTFAEAIYTGQGLTVPAAGKQFSSRGDRPLHKLSDPIEREIPEQGVKPPVSKRAARKSSK